MLPPRLTTLALALVPLLALTACGDGDGGGATSAGDRAKDTAKATPSASTVACSYADDRSGGGAEVDAPPATAVATGEVAVRIETSAGPLSATLDAAATPCTVNSFLSLAEQGYFDDTPCHRLVTPPASIAVLQCGDPTGTGAGGPGYSFPDELTGAETYGPGTLAMANAGPDTNGSQFFLVFGPSQLRPDFTVFGHVDDAAVQVLEKVAAAGTDNAFGAGDGHPNTPVQVESITAD